MNKIRALTLTVKYYLQGDDWQKAREYANSLVYGFRRLSK